MSDEKIKSYPKSENENFFIVDTIGVPHPYMIGPKHVAHASDKFGGMLSKESIEDGEKHDIYCAMQFKGGGKCQLSYKQHETTLLVACKKEIKGEDGKADPELHEYLLKIKE